jgi:hypothetical protein
VKGGGNDSFGVTEENHKARETGHMEFHPLLERNTSPFDDTRPSNVKDNMLLEVGQSSGYNHCN